MWFSFLNVLEAIINSLLLIQLTFIFPILIQSFPFLYFQFYSLYQYLSFSFLFSLRRHHPELIVIIIVMPEPEPFYWDY